jgi:hypothetical protein
VLLDEKPLDDEAAERIRGELVARFPEVQADLEMKPTALRSKLVRMRAELRPLYPTVADSNDREEDEHEEESTIDDEDDAETEVDDGLAGADAVMSRQDELQQADHQLPDGTLLLLARAINSGALRRESLAYAVVADIAAFYGTPAYASAPERFVRRYALQTGLKEACAG